MYCNVIQLSEIEPQKEKSVSHMYSFILDVVLQSFLAAAQLK